MEPANLATYPVPGIIEWSYVLRDRLRVCPATRLTPGGPQSTVVPVLYYMRRVVVFAHLIYKVAVAVRIIADLRFRGPKT